MYSNELITLYERMRFLVCASTCECPGCSCAGSPNVKNAWLPRTAKERTSTIQRRFGMASGSSCASSRPLVWCPLNPGQGLVCGNCGAFVGGLLEQLDALGRGTTGKTR